MFVSLDSINPDEVRFLFCSDTRLAEEIEAVNRSLKPHGEEIDGWAYLDPRTDLDGKEAIACV